jgi:hypothetical protein
LSGLNDAIFSATPELRVPDGMRGRNVDGHAETFPSCVVPPEITLHLEFVYVVDLDRETFTCQRRWPQRWLWRLDAIPRGEAYYAALERGENVERLLSRKLHDHAPDDTPAMDAGAGSTSQMYDAAIMDDAVPHTQFIGYGGGLPADWRRYTPDDELDHDSPFATSHSLRLFLLQQLVSRFRHVLGENVIPGTIKENKRVADYMYREFAFAILSIAAGNFALVDADSLPLYEPHDLSLSTTTMTSDECHGEKVAETWLPSFGSRVHKRGVEPGCAPTTLTYWLENVLVSVIAGDLREEQLGGTDIVATVNAARTFARRTRATSPSETYYGVVFSITGVVLYCARIDGEYKHSGYHSTDAATAAAATSADRDSAFVTVSDYLPLLPESLLVSHHRTRLPWGCGAFMALMHHFDAALPPVGACNCGALPDELLERVLMATATAGHWRAYSALAHVTPALQTFARRRVVLHDVVLRDLGEWVHPRRLDKSLCDGLYYTDEADGAEYEKDSTEDEGIGAGEKMKEKEKGTMERYLVPLPSDDIHWTVGLPGRRLLHLVLGNDPQRMCLVAEVGAMLLDCWHHACNYAAN